MMQILINGCISDVLIDLLKSNLRCGGMWTYILYSDGTCVKMVDACRKVCSNNEAEIMRIESALKYGGMYI